MVHGFVFLKAWTDVERERERASHKRLALLCSAPDYRLALERKDDAVQLDAVENEQAWEAAEDVTECQWDAPTGALTVDTCPHRLAEPGALCGI